MNNKKSISSFFKEKSSNWDISVILDTIIIEVSTLGLNYLFLDKKTINQDIINALKELDYNVIVGQGDVARIKITW